MTTPYTSDASLRWLWWSSLAAFLIGLGLGWRSLSDEVPIPVETYVIAASHLELLTLGHPFPNPPPASASPGKMRISLHATPGKDDPALAEVVQPLAFNLSSPWLKALLAKKLPNLDRSFSLKMRGWIYLPAPVTHLHLRSDNGYRVRLRDAQGGEARVGDWADDVTDDFYFRVTAEPGYYQLEIDYTNVQGDGFFDLWSEAGGLQFFPAEPGPGTAPPVGSAR